MDFGFIFPKQLIVKRGGIDDIGKVCAPHMKKACLFRYGQHFLSSGAYDRVKYSLDAAGIESFLFHAIPGEPSTDVVDEAATFMRKNNCDGGLAIGGGSVIDTAKAACALAPNGAEIMDHIEGFNPQPFAKAPFPVVAVPTTAGTGSECTKNSVITNKGRFKNSVRDDHMIPVVAMLDAELALDVPQNVTATAGADCICHLVECYVSRFANPLSDAISLPFIKSAFGALDIAYQDGKDIDAREQMLLASYAAGLGMSNAGLGMAHGIAAGMGAMTPLQHGFICGVALPAVMAFNISKGIIKYADIARNISEKTYTSDKDAALDAVCMVDALNQRIGIPADFRGLGIDKADVKKIAAACMGSSMGKNPVDVSLAECETLLHRLIG